MSVILETVGLTHGFGRAVVADNLNVQIKTGERVGIVGPNGAGKTSFVNMVTGYIKPDQGQILYLGSDITPLSPRAITGLGISRSFQIPQLFTSLSVRENVMIALAARAGKSLDFWNRLKKKVWLAEALDLLEQFGLGSYADRPVSVLPEGGRKLLDIALSLALKPRLLFMDEPTSGVSAQDKFKVMDTLTDVLQQVGVTIIFVEHDMDVVYRYADRVLAFSYGQIMADGDPQALFADADIRRAVVGWEYQMTNDE